jgi:hypothetical protein
VHLFNGLPIERRGWDCGVAVDDVVPEMSVAGGEEGQELLPWAR